MINSSVHWARDKKPRLSFLNKQGFLTFQRNAFQNDVVAFSRVPNWKCFQKPNWSENERESKKN
jgi:hypothetical protein